MRMGRAARRTRRGTAGMVATIIMFAILFTVGTGYFIFINSTNQKYVQSLVGAANRIQGVNGESMQITTLLLSNSDVGFYANNTSGVTINMTTLYIQSPTGALLKCEGVGLPASAGCTNTTPALWQVVNPGKGSKVLDTNFQDPSWAVDTLIVATARGNTFSQTYPNANTAVAANSAQSLTANPATFKWTTIQSSSANLVQSKYSANCNAAACGLQYTSGVTAGNTLVYGLGWYNQNPPAAPTDTVGTTFTLGPSSSVVAPVTASFVQSKYSANCNAANCGATFNSNVASGNVLAFGLGWFGQSPPSAPTDTRGDSFTLGASQSVVYNPPSPLLVQSRYTSNCNSATCGLAYSSSVTSGNTLVFGLGWYGTSPYVPITVTNCQPQSSSITLIQHGPSVESTTSTLSTSLTANVQSGDLVLLMFNFWTGQSISSVSGYGVSTWNVAVSKVDSGSSLSNYVYYGISSGGSNTGTVTFSGTIQPSEGSAAEFSGVSNPVVLDGSNVNNGGSNTSPSTGSLTTTNAKDLLIAFEGDNTGYGESAGPTNGFALLDHNSVSQNYASAYNIVSSTGSYSTSWTIPQASYWVGMIAAFKAGTAGCIPAISVDGHSAANSGTAGTTISTSLTTSNSNDVIIVQTKSGATAQTVQSISDTAGLSWQLRAAVALTNRDEEEWYAIAPNPLSSDSITATFTASTSNQAILVFGISGANTASPYDPNASLPAKNEVTTAGAPSLSGISTSNANDMLIGLETSPDNTAETTGAGYTMIDGTTSSANDIYAEQQVVSSTQSSITISFGTSLSRWSMIADAIQAAPATSNPFQERVTWNPSTYSTYEANNLGNIRFCADSACATPLKAWLESCTPSCSTSATSATAWVKLTSSIASGGSTTIYMVFQATSVNFDTNNWGEAPNLSGTYGQYDNGANVFTFYDGFVGSTLSSTNWQTVIYGGGTVTQNNGLVISTTSTSNNPMLVSKNTYSPAVEDASMQLSPQQTGSSTPGIFYATTLPTTTGGDYGFQTAYRYDWAKSSGLFRLIDDISGTYSGGSTLSYTLPSTYNVWSATWSATGNEILAFNYATEITWTNSGISYGSAYIGAAATQGGQANLNWLRLRAYPPNNVMPSTSFGSVTTGNGSPSGPTDTLGDTFTLGASNSITASNQNYYSYIWYTTALSSGTDTISATFASAVTGSVSIYELQGYTIVGPMSSTGSSQSGSASLSVTSFTPASNSFVVGNAETASSSSTYTAGSGFTLVATCSSVYGCSEYQSGVGTATTVPVTLGVSAPWVESAVSFAPLSSSTYYSYIWYATAASSGADTISASFSSAVTGSVSMFELSGLSTTGVLSSTGSSSTASGSASVTSLTPSAGSIVVGNTEASPTTYTAGTSFTLAGTCNSVNGCGEYQAGVGSATTVPMSLSPSSAWVEAAVAFAPKTNTYYSYIWWGAAGATGTDTITATFSQAVTGSVSIYELNGYATSGITTSTGNLAAGSTTPAVTAFTPGTNSIVIGNVETPSSSFTAGTGFTAISTCSSVNGCSEDQTGVSSLTTAPMTLNPSAAWVEVAIAFPAGPVLQSGYQVGGFPSSAIPYNTYLAWRVQFTNQDSQGRSVTLWPKSLAAIESIIQETVEITPWFIVDGVSTDGSSLIAYNSTKPFVTIPYKQTVTVYFGATVPRGTGTDRVDTANEIAPFTGFFALEGIYSDGTLFGLTVPYPAGEVTNSNGNTSPTAGLTSTTVTATCNSPCNFNANSNAYVGWFDATGHLTILKTFTMTSGGNIPNNTTFQVPSATPGYYTVVISDYVNSVYIAFQHT